MYILYRRGNIFFSSIFQASAQWTIQSRFLMMGLNRKAYHTTSLGVIVTTEHLVISQVRPKQRQPLMIVTAITAAAPAKVTTQARRWQRAMPQAQKASRLLRTTLMLMPTTNPLYACVWIYVFPYNKDWKRCVFHSVLCIPLLPWVC